MHPFPSSGIPSNWRPGDYKYNIQTTQPPTKTQGSCRYPDGIFFTPTYNLANLWRCRFCDAWDVDSR